MASDEAQGHWLSFAAGAGAFIFLFGLSGWRSPRKPGVQHVYLIVQSAIVVWMLDLDPNLDSTTAFFVPLAFQAALFFAGRWLWTWIGLLAICTAAALAFYLGLFEGLALALSPAAFIVGLPALMVANQETEIAGQRSQALLTDLEETHRRLRAYAGQVEELALLRERGRLARELHDTVSQLIFSITLTSRATKLLLARDPGRVRQQLERVRETSTGALSQLRSLILQMRL